MKQYEEKENALEQGLDNVTNMSEQMGVAIQFLKKIKK